MKRIVVLLVVFCMCFGSVQVLAEEAFAEEAFTEEVFTEELFSEELVQDFYDSMDYDVFEEFTEELVIQCAEDEGEEIESLHAENASDHSPEILSYGSNGDAVLQLQTVLYSLGYLTLQPDGVFGAYTLKAVKLFQLYNGMDITGTVDADSMEDVYNKDAVKFYNLSSGTYGAAVKGLQVLLSDLGYLEVTADGVFGNYTYQAVKKFQEKNGISTDGIAGRLTMSKLFDSPTATSSGQIPSDQELSLWMQSDTVKQLQEKLSALGYLDVAADGIYGSYTELAVKMFQMYNGLPVTGTADTDTISTINSGSPISFTYLYKGKYGTPVLSLQQLLSEMGYLTVAADGGYGNYTYLAVQSFQKENGLPADGTVGRLTIEKLFHNPVTKLVNDGITRELSEGMEGEDVQKFQQKLKSLGYLSETEDTFGQNTVTAVKIFQIYNHLPVTGEADQTTIDTVYSDKVTGFFQLKKGNFHDAVTELQNLLSGLGYLKVNADGVYGSYTRSAVRLFQLENGIRSDCIVGLYTWSVLLSDPAPYREGMEDEYPELVVENYGDDNGRLLITWSKISNADGYCLYRSKSAASGFELINVTETACKYIDWALNPGTTYYYKVEAYSGNVLGEASEKTMIAEIGVESGTTNSYTTSYYWTDTSVKPNVLNTVYVTAADDSSAEEIFSKLENGTNFYVYVKNSSSSDAWWIMYGLKKKVSTLNDEAIGFVWINHYYSDGGYYFLIDAQTYIQVKNYIAMAYAERMEEYGIYLDNGGSDEYFYDYHNPDSYSVRYIANYRDSLFEAQYGAKFTEMSSESRFLFTTPGTNMVVRTDYMVFDLDFNTVGETALDIIHKMSNKTAIGVCRHFALAVDTICDYLDIQCWTPTDYGYNHQWAIVKACDNDGNVVWYLVDNQNVIQLKSEDDLKYRPVKDMIWDYSIATKREMGSAYPF